MGYRSNPILLRLGYSVKWSSTSFIKYDYNSQQLAHLQTYNYLVQLFRSSFFVTKVVLFSHIDYLVYNNKLVINIHLIDKRLSWTKSTRFMWRISRGKLSRLQRSRSLLAWKPWTRHVKFSNKVYLRRKKLAQFIYILAKYLLPYVFDSRNPITKLIRAVVNRGDFINTLNLLFRFKFRIVILSWKYRRLILSFRHYILNFIKLVKLISAVLSRNNKSSRYQDNHRISRLKQLYPILISNTNLKQFDEYKKETLRKSKEASFYTKGHMSFISEGQPLLKKNIYKLYFLNKSKHPLRKKKLKNYRFTIYKKLIRRLKSNFRRSRTTSLKKKSHKLRIIKGNCIVRRRKPKFRKSKLFHIKLENIKPNRRPVVMQGFNEVYLTHYKIPYKYRPRNGYIYLCDTISRGNSKVSKSKKTILKLYRTKAAKSLKFILRRKVTKEKYRKSTKLVNLRNVKLRNKSLFGKRNKLIFKYRYKRRRRKIIFRIYGLAKRKYRIYKKKGKKRLYTKKILKKNLRILLKKRRRSKIIFKIRRVLLNKGTRLLRLYRVKYIRRKFRKLIKLSKLKSILNNLNSHKFLYFPNRGYSKFLRIYEYQKLREILLKNNKLKRGVLRYFKFRKLKPRKYYIRRSKTPGLTFNKNFNRHPILNNYRNTSSYKNYNQNRYNNTFKNKDSVKFNNFNKSNNYRGTSNRVNYVNYNENRSEHNYKYNNAIKYNNYGGTAHYIDYNKDRYHNKFKYNNTVKYENYNGFRNRYHTYNGGKKLNRYTSFKNLNNYKNTYGYKPYNRFNKHKFGRYPFRSYKKPIVFFFKKRKRRKPPRIRRLRRIRILRSKHNYLYTKYFKPYVVKKSYLFKNDLLIFRQRKFKFLNIKKLKQFTPKYKNLSSALSRQLRSKLPNNQEYGSDIEAYYLKKINRKSKSNRIFEYTYNMSLNLNRIRYSLKSKLHNFLSSKFSFNKKSFKLRRHLFFKRIFLKKWSKSKFKLPLKIKFRPFKRKILRMKKRMGRIKQYLFKDLLFYRRYLLYKHANNFYIFMYKMLSPLFRLKLFCKTLFKFLRRIWYTQLAIIVRSDFIKMIGNLIIVNFIRVKRGCYRPDVISRFIVFRLMYQYRFGEIIFPLLKELSRNRIANRILGAMIICSGRLTRRQRASRRSLVLRKIGLNTLSSNILYSFNTVRLRYGVSGIKLFINYKN